MAKYFKFILSILIALVIVKVISPILAIFGWIICMVIFIGGLIIECIKEKDTRLGADVLKNIDYITLMLLAGLFMVIDGIDRVGIIADLSNIIAGLGAGNIFLTYSIIVWFSVIASAFIDNIPYTATMLPVVAGVAASLGVNQTVLCFGLLVGATLGGNLTPVGASANIAAGGFLRKAGYEVSTKQFMSIGVPFTLAAVITGYVLTWLFYAGL